MTGTLRILLALASAMLGCAAQAHAFLDHADPKAGSTVQAAPAQIRLWFTERLEPAFSTAEVVDESGKRVDAAAVKIDGADPTQVRIAVPPLKAGRYTVTWRVLSVDTHVSQGDFSFTVAPRAP